MDLEKIQAFREDVRRLEREISKQLKSETECCGVTMSQCHLILEIGSRGDASIVELADILNVDTSTLSRNINGMVSLELADRVINPNDRRYVSVTLTDKGRRVYDSINSMCNSYYQKVFDYIPEENRLPVIESFSMLVKAIIKASKSGIQCCSDDSI